MNERVLVDILFTLSGAISTILSFMVIYVVAFHSPQSMSGYKRFVINFTSWDFLFSLSISTLIRPEVIFPYNGAYVNGLFKYLGDVGAQASLVFLINTTAHALSSQFHCLFFRYAILQNNQRLLDFILSWKTWFRGWIVAFSISSSAGIFIFAPMQDSQKEVREQILSLSHLFPNSSLPDFNRIIMYTPPTSANAVYAGIFIFIGFFIFEVASLGVVYMTLRQLENQKASFSIDTYKLHRQLTIALGIQLLTPFLHIVAPVSVWVIYNYPHGRMSYVTATLFNVYIDFYGASNALITLFMVKPYRTYLKLKAQCFLKFISLGSLFMDLDRNVSVLPESTLNISSVN